MNTPRKPGTGTRFALIFAPAVAALAIAALAAALAAPPEAAGDEDEDAALTRESLLDRILIEDLLTRYYVDLTSGTGHDLARYFTEDAVFDVNGMVAEGREAIRKLYEGVGGEEANLGGRVHMLLGNPVIRVRGDTATAWLVWTGVMNDNIRLAPRLLEQGREYTELVRRDGRWRIRKRYVTADSGMPALWDATYRPREPRDQP